VINVISDPIYTNVLNENAYPTRQKLIKLIQEKLGGKLICYIESAEHPLAGISQHDPPYFEDLLRSTAESKKGFLLLNSAGGNPNSAEKLLMMCRKRFTEEFTIIVPNFAKSAATMMCLGSDKIMMGYLAELGPIDPQISTAPNTAPIPARSFIEGLELVRKNVKDGDPATMYLSMLQRIPPQLISICRTAIEDSKTFAESWLSKYMLKNNSDQAKKVAQWLSEGDKYKSHGKVIDSQEAKNELQLNVESIDPLSELWYWIWELYVRSTLFIKTRGIGAAKLYESDATSLVLNIDIIQQRPMK